MGRYIYENVSCDRIHDGDTVTLTIDCGFHFYRRRQTEGVSYRLARINAPELKDAGGKEAREALRLWVEGVPLRVETLRDPDKYGRFLVEIEALVGGTWMQVNDAMVAGGFAEYRSY